MSRKKISILGSTGSIGTQTLDIVSAHPEELQVAAMATGGARLEEFSKQVREFKPDLVSVKDSQSASALKALLADQNSPPEIMHGQEGLVAVATHRDVHSVVTAVVGFLGLVPTAEAIKAGKTICLANKETLVAAGNLIMPMAQRNDAKIVPVDSEHSAIFQSLAGHTIQDIHKIWLTASGGPFRTWSAAEMERATRDDALKHPNWSMGAKITIDSATLMNKGLEVIEARFLFQLSPERISVVVHPQSILHSAVEFADGSVIGQMGLPDMRLPIHYALFYPHRVASNKVPRLDFLTLKDMTFEAPDTERFPCLELAKAVAADDGTYACALNAANEIAVEAFLANRIKFMDIPKVVQNALDHHDSVSNPSLADILEADRKVREYCREQFKTPACAE